MLFFYLTFTIEGDEVRTLIYAFPNYTIYQIPAEVTNISDGTPENYVFKDVSKQSENFEVSFEEGCKLAYIGQYSFYLCGKLTKIDFSNAKHLKSIQSYAFAGCGINRLDFTQNLELIEFAGYASFHGCKKLASIIFPDNSAVTKINGGTFRYCSLTSFRIPKNCITLSGETFGYCPINEFTVEKGSTHFNTFHGSLYSYSLQSLICYCHNDNDFTLPEQTTSINWLAFEGYPYSIVIPKQIVNFNPKAFFGYQGTSLSIMCPPDELLSEMFAYCSNLQILYFFNTVKSIKEKSFIYSTALKYIFFISPVNEIHPNAFPKPDKICFAGAVDSIRKCLPNVYIHECKLTILRSKTFIYQTPKPNLSLFFIIIIMC